MTFLVQSYRWSWCHLNCVNFRNWDLMVTGWLVCPLSLWEDPNLFKIFIYKIMSLVSIRYQMTHMTPAPWSPDPRQMTSQNDHTCNTRKTFYIYCECVAKHWHSFWVFVVLCSSLFLLNSIHVHHIHMSGHCLAIVSA